MKFFKIERLFYVNKKKSGAQGTHKGRPVIHSWCESAFIVLFFLICNQDHCMKKRPCRVGDVDHFGNVGAVKIGTLSCNLGWQ